ncbi:MAG: NUDIX domain-containing protein [Bacilli bacterium]
MEPLKTSYCGSTFIIDLNKQKILLIYHKKFQNWIQPGGHLKEGESPEEGAIRQAYEETGVRVKLVYQKPFMVEEYNNFAGNIIDYQYVAVPVTDNQTLVNSEESFTLDWFSLEELEHIPVFPDVKTKAKIFLTPGFHTE